MAASSPSAGALVSAVIHMVGQSRAFLHQVETAIEEIGRLHDDRADRLVEAFRLTHREPAGPCTLRHVEQTASELLRTLHEGDGL